MSKKRAKKGRATGKNTTLLPILAAAPAIRPSRTPRKRATVLIAVHLLAALHIAHWWLNGSTLSPVEPSEAMELSKQGIINAGAIFFGLTIASTLLLGRFFCGWGCHLVALQDLSAWMLAKIGIRPRPLRSRLLALVPLIAFVYMFLWPIVYRLWIAAPVSQFEVHLMKESFWATFPGWAVALLTFAVCGFVIVYFLGAKGFCTYACPYGAIFGVADRLAPGKIRVSDACEGCGHCTAVCTSNVRVHEEVRDFGMVMDPGCMKCMDCVSVCPNDALYFGLGKPAILTKRRTEPAPKKRRLAIWEEALLGIACAAAFLSFRGLYDVVPFLLSLGLSAVLAFLCLQVAWLFTRPNLRLRHWQLKQGGVIQTKGRVFLILMLALFTLWVHSAFIRYHTFVGNRFFDRTADFRQEALALDTHPALPPDQWTLVDAARHHLRLARDRGLLDSPILDYRLAWMHLLLGQGEAFERRARATLEADPENAVMHLLIGRQRTAEGRYPEALEAYSASIQANPKVLNAYLGLGTLLARLGDLEQAKRVFARADDEIPEVPEVYFNSGLIVALQGSSTEAVAFFERALELNADYLAARENLAGVLASTGHFGESIEHYRRAIAQSPADPETRFLAARVHAELGEWESAEAELREALRLNPHFQAARDLMRLLPAP